MQIKDITFTLENCDSITISGKYIGEFHIGEVSTTLSRVACNSVQELDIANYFSIEIHKDANVNHIPFGELRGSLTTVFDRLTIAHDISSIDITMIDCSATKKSNKEKSYTFYPLWEDDKTGIENKNEKTYISAAGWLYIVIHPTKELSDIFDIESIDDDLYQESKAKLYCIGNAYSQNEENLKTNEKQSDSDASEKPKRGRKKKNITDKGDN